MKYQLEHVFAGVGVSPPFGEVWIEIIRNRVRNILNMSPPFGEVWIEIFARRSPACSTDVTSLRGGVD